MSSLKIQRKYSFYAISVCVLCFLCFYSLHGLMSSNRFAAQPAETAIERYSTDGAWCWYQDPRAVRYSGAHDNTYLGWVDSEGDIVISSYENQTGLKVVHVLHQSLQKDDHAAPSILVRSDGRLMVFYSAHVGGEFYYRISVNPEDVSSWSEEHTIDTNTSGTWEYTYSNPIQLSGENDKIYLFWRGGNGNPTFSTSTDGGKTWADAQTLFSVPGERPYVKEYSDGKSRIYFSLTDGHPNEVEHNSLYFAYYESGGFYKADGSFIKSINDVPLLPQDVDVVYDSRLTGMQSWNWDISADGEGRPVIAYAVFPNKTDHRYRYAHWNGVSWDDNEMVLAGESIDPVHEPFYSGGMALDHENPSVVYLSRGSGDVYSLERWITKDQGVQWSSEVVSDPESGKNIRPVVPRYHGASGPQLFWMNGKYPWFTEFETGIMAKIIL